MILALEFSSDERSVAVLLRRASSESGGLLAEVSESGRRSSGPLALVDRVLTEAQIDREAIDCIAVGLGPGSYTGIRSAIALAQGWQLARQVRLIGISTVECLAAQARDNGWFGTVCFVVDAQRDEFYLAAYSIGENEVRSLEPLRLVKAAEVRQMGALRRDTLADAHAGITEKNPAIIAGPEADRWFPDGFVLKPSAIQLARLAGGRDDFVPGEKLEPIYLRETQFVKAPPPRVLPAESAEGL